MRHYSEYNRRFYYVFNVTVSLATKCPVNDIVSTEGTYLASIVFGVTWPLNHLIYSHAIRHIR